MASTQASFRFQRYPSPTRRRVLMMGTGLALSTVIPSLSQAANAPSPLKVGVTTGPHEQVFEVVKKVARRQFDLNIQIVPFSDYIQPNAALDAGDLHANSFQHRPFLAAQIRARGYKLAGLGRTWIGPIGVYSKKYKSFKDLPDGATIGIPNDPANESRVLLLIQSTGAIKLRTGIDPIAGINATPRDIVDNAKKFKFVEIDAAQLPRTLDDFQATTVNADYALKAGLNPARDAILLEGSDGPYACLIAVREADRDAAWAQQLVQAYQTAEVRRFILDTFAGGIIPAF